MTSTIRRMLEFLVMFTISLINTTKCGAVPGYAVDENCQLVSPPPSICMDPTIIDWPAELPSPQAPVVVNGSILPIPPEERQRRHICNEIGNKNYSLISACATTFRVIGTGDVWSANVTTHGLRESGSRPDYDSMASVVVYTGCSQQRQNNDSIVSNQLLESPTNSSTCSIFSPRQFRWKTEVGVEYTIVIHHSDERKQTNFTLELRVFETVSLCETSRNSSPFKTNNNEHQKNRVVAPIDLGVLSFHETTTVIFNTEAEGKIFHEFVSEYSYAAPNSGYYHLTLNPSAAYLVSVPPGPPALLIVNVTGFLDFVSVFEGECDEVGGWTKLTKQGEWRDSEHNYRAYLDEGTYLVLFTYSQERYNTDIILDFTLDLEKDGDVCTDAQIVELQDGYTIPEIAAGHSFENLPLADGHYGTTSYSKVFLYEIIGNGKALIVRGGRNVYMPSGIWVLSSNSCEESLEFLPSTLLGNRFSYIMQEQWVTFIVFPSVEGQTYYIETQSDFAIEILSSRDGNMCHDARKFTVGGDSNASFAFRGTMSDARRFGELQWCDRRRTIGFGIGQAFAVTANESGYLKIRISAGEKGKYFGVLAFRGNCARPLCKMVDAYHTTSDYSYHGFDVFEGATYFIFISELSSDQREFDLEVTFLPVGDVCSDAIPIEDVTDGLEITGSMDIANYYNNVLEQPRFFSYVLAPVTLYSIRLRTAKHITFSIDKPEDHAFLAVYEGLNCSGALALTTNDCQYNCFNTDYLNAKWGFLAEELTWYYMVVHTNATNFTLLVDVMSEEAYENDEKRNRPYGQYLDNSETSPPPSFQGKNQAKSPLPTSPQDESSKEPAKNGFKRSLATMQVILVVFMFTVMLFSIALARLSKLRGNRSKGSYQTLAAEKIAADSGEQCGA